MKAWGDFLPAVWERADVMTLQFSYLSELRTVMLGLILLIQCNAGTPLAMAIDGDVQHAAFAGSLIQPGEGDGEILRRFEVQLLSAGNNHFFHVMDDARTGCPWPDSFGQCGPSVGLDKVQPHLDYSYDGNVYLIGLPPLVVALPEDLQPDATWEQAGWQLTAIEQQTLNSIPAWVVEARERRGRQQTLIVESATGLTLRAETEVFMGQGEQFQLTLARSAVKSLDSAMSAQIGELQKELLSLQATLKRRPDAHQSELSQRQVSDVMASIGTLTTLAKSTPLEGFARQIKADAEQQQKRLASAADRASALLNSEAPEFSLTLVSGEKLESASLKGKTVVLHFWDYRDAPLSEPYGQTGYLEFLFNQKKKLNVQVVGVSTNPDLQVTENVARGRRSARKLSEFMNLSYPIGHDDGSLLEAFGDPRDAKGQLPLWIVLSPAGIVAHYHAGFYEVDATQGLKELEAVLSEQTRAK